MKTWKILLMLLLGTLPLQAQTTMIERTMPATPDFGPGQLKVNDFETVAADFELGACFVLYNVGAQAYFGEGNAWRTQASVTKDTPLLVRFTLPEGKTLDDAALLFNDYSNAKNAWKLVFFDSVTQMYVDLGSQANYFWQVLPADGEKTYRLQASSLNPQYNPTSCSGFVGLDVSSSQDNTALSSFLDEGDGHYLDWQFFAVPAWTQYFKEKDIYDAAQLLKTLIAKAESIGCDVSAAVAVYNDLNATMEQLQQAFDSLHAAIIAKMADGTAGQPGDGTLLINNPNFDNASAEGWRGDKPNMVGNGSHGPADVAEFYNRAFDTYQMIDGLPDGVYALRANTLFRGSMEDMQNGTESAAKLYATVGEEMTTAPFINVWAARNTEPMAGETPWGTTATETTAHDNMTNAIYYGPNDPSAARLYFEKGFYQNVLFFEVSGGKVRLGVRNDVRSEGSDNWAVFDNFTLSYYGNTQESYQAWAAQGVPVYEIPEGAVYSWAYADAYHEALASRNATNKAEALAAMDEVKVRIADLQANINAWIRYTNIYTDYVGLIEHCKSRNYAERFWRLEDVQAAMDYFENTYINNLNARELTTEQLQEEWTKAELLYDRLMKANFNYDEEILVEINGLKYKLIPSSWTAIVANENKWEGELDIPMYVTYGDVPNPYTVRGMEWLAFNGSEQLTKVTIPQTVRNIQHYAEYEDCKNPFVGCTNLERIEVDEGNHWMTSVDGVLYSKDQTQLYSYPAGAKSSSYDVPDGVTWIGGDAFAYNKHLRSVTMPNSVTRICFGLFNGCKNLETVRLSESITHLPAYLFDHCESIKHLDIPESVSSFAESVFRWTNFSSIVIRGTFPQGLRNDTFYKMSDTTVLYVQRSELEKFKEVYSGLVLPLDDYHPTAITTLQSPVTPPSYFDLQGRRLNGKPEKGVYIQNGKKSIVR